MNYFIDKNYLIDADLDYFSCRDNAIWDNAGAPPLVELEQFPCTISAGDGGPMDVLECQGVELNSVTTSKTRAL